MAGEQAMKFRYDKEQDILLLHLGYGADECFVTNIDAGPVILDVADSGRVRGIEILDASRVLAPFLDPAVLATVTGGKLATIPSGSGYVVTLELNHAHGRSPAVIAISSSD